MTNRHLVVLVALISGIGFTIGPSRGQSNAGSAFSFLKAYDRGDGAQRRELELQISMIEEGFVWANEELKSRKSPPLYCVSDKLVLTGSQLFDIVRRVTREDKSLSNAPLGKALLSSMQRVFPCPPDSKLRAH